jgi:hypothetical protein
MFFYDTNLCLRFENITSIRHRENEQTQCPRNHRRILDLVHGLRPWHALTFSCLLQFTSLSLLLSDYNPDFSIARNEDEVRSVSLYSATSSNANSDDPATDEDSGDGAALEAGMAQLTVVTQTCRLLTIPGGKSSAQPGEM